MRGNGGGGKKGNGSQGHSLGCSTGSSSSLSQLGDQNPIWRGPRLARKGCRGRGYGKRLLGGEADEERLRVKRVQRFKGRSDAAGQVSGNRRSAEGGRLPKCGRNRFRGTYMSGSREKGLFWVTRGALKAT